MTIVPILAITDPKKALSYASRREKRWPEGEYAIKQSARMSYLYLRDVIQGRDSEFEAVLLTSPYYSFLYAINIRGNRWPAAEVIICQTEFAWQYLEYLQVPTSARMLILLKIAAFRIKTLLKGK